MQALTTGQTSLLNETGGSKPLFILTPGDGLVSATADFNKTAAYSSEHRYWGQLRLFSHASALDAQISSIEETLRALVHRDNMFTDIDSVKRFLANRLYGLTSAPRLIELSEQRAAAVEQMIAGAPETVRQLAEWTAERFIGNAYTLDGSYRVGIGEQLPLSVLRQKLPDLCAHFFGDVKPEEITSTPTAKARGFVREFARLAQPKHAVAFAELLDYPDEPATQTSTARFIKGNWQAFRNDFDGLSFTDHYTDLSGTKTKAWPVTEILTDWAIPHSQEIGTVADLVRSGHVRWPGAKEWSPMKDFFNLLSAGGRRDRAREYAYKKEADSLKKDIAGPSQFKLR